MEQDSFDSFDDIEEMVMAANNLSLSPNGAMSGDQRDSLNVSGEEDELPKSIIVTNVDLSVFDNLDIKVIKIPYNKFMVHASFDSTMCYHHNKCRFR